MLGLGIYLAIRTLGVLSLDMISLDGVVRMIRVTGFDRLDLDQFPWLSFFYLDFGYIKCTL